jgi:hypothetical protein
VGEGPEFREPTLGELAGHVAKYSLNFGFLLGAHWLLKWFARQTGQEGVWWVVVGEVALALAGVINLISALTSETAIGCIRAFRRVTREWRRRQ